MSELTDNELLSELDRRFKINNKVLEQQTKLLIELESVNEKLLEAEKVKTQFLSNIRNEINNPLSSIIGLSESFSNHYNDKKGIDRISKLIYNEAFDLNYQLHNIFVAAELESGRLKPEIANADIKELLEQLINEFKHKADRKGIKITLHSNFERNVFRTDAEKLHLIVANLLANAIEFSNNHSEIKIVVEALNNKLSIMVQDFGIGIKLDDQTKIYDRFKQLQSGSTKGYGGHGLGLTIIKDLIYLLEGGINLESELEVGSSFTIILLEAEETKNLNKTLGGNEFLFEEGDELF